MTYDVLCCAVLCCAVLCCAVLCCAVLCCAVLCCAVLCDAMRCDALRCAALRCDAMRCDAMRCDAMRCDAMRWQLAMCAMWNGLFAGGGALGAQIAVAIRAGTGSFAAATCFLAAAGGLGATVLALAVVRPNMGRARTGVLKASLLPEDPQGINS
jgi:pentapeptide MXKDX repeat protein